MSLVGNETCRIPVGTDDGVGVGIGVAVAPTTTQPFQFSLTVPASPPHPSTAILYIVPPVALKVTLLVTTTPDCTSSLNTIRVSEPTELPVYTATIVSK